MDPVKELEKLQIEFGNLEKDLALKQSGLSKEFLDACYPLYERRKQLVLGEAEPNDAEVGELEEDSHEPSTAGLHRVAKEVQGIPKFWLRVLKGQEVTAEHIQKQDEAALAYLEDISCKRPTLTGYQINFQFAANPYFTDKVLTKEVVVPSPTAPLSSAVPKEGTGIVHWKEDMNLTVRKVEKKQKGSKRKGGNVSEVKLKPCQSFFNFFGASSRKSRAGDDSDGETTGPLESGRTSSSSFLPAEQSELFMALWNEVVPRAIELYAAEGPEVDLRDPDDIVPEDAAAETQSFAVRRRIMALQNLHHKRLALKKVHEAKLAKLAQEVDLEYAAVYDMRRSVVVGSKAESSGQWEDMTLPRFWLLALKGCDTTVELVRKRDEAVLCYLMDVRCSRGARGFKLEFEFLPNPFFSNKVLTKTCVFGEDGESIARSEGATIDWHDEKDVTVRVTTAEASSGKRLSKAKPCPSFFWLFAKEGGQRLFASESGAPLSGPELRDLEVNLALVLKGTLVPHALELYQDAAKYAALAGSDDSEEDEEPLDGEDDLDSDAVRGLLKGKGKKRRGEGKNTVCCGLDRGQVLVILVLSLVAAEVFVFFDFLSMQGS